MGLFDNLFKSKPAPGEESVVEAARRITEAEKARLVEAEKVSKPTGQKPSGSGNRAAHAPVARAYSPRSLGQAVPPRAVGASKPNKAVRFGVSGESGRPQEIRLFLEDILARIPPDLLNDGPRDGRREIRFRVEDVSADIARGRAAVALVRIAEQVPEIFRQPISAADETVIRLPLQKLVEQIGFLPVNPPLPESRALRPAPPVQPLPLNRPQVQAVSPATPPAPASDSATVGKEGSSGKPDGPVSTNEPASEAIPAASEQSIITQLAGTPEPKPSPDEPEAITSSSEALKEADQPTRVAADLVDAGAPADAKISLSLAAILRECPKELICAPLPPISEADRVTLALAPIRKQIPTGRVEISSVRFVFALPPHLQPCFEAREGVRIPLPLDEIIRNLPGALDPVRAAQQTDLLPSGTALRVPGATTVATPDVSGSVSPQPEPPAGTGMPFIVPVLPVATPPPGEASPVEAHREREGVLRGAEVAEASPTTDQGTGGLQAEPSENITQAVDPQRFDSIQSGKNEGYKELSATAKAAAAERSTELLNPELHERSEAPENVPDSPSFPSEEGIAYRVGDSGSDQVPHAEPENPRGFGLPEATSETLPYVSSEPFVEAHSHNLEGATASLPAEETTLSIPEFEPAGKQGVQPASAAESIENTSSNLSPPTFLSDYVEKENLAVQPPAPLESFVGSELPAGSEVFPANDLQGNQNEPRDSLTAAGVYISIPALPLVPAPVITGLQLPTVISTESIAGAEPQEASLTSELSSAPFVPPRIIPPPVSPGVPLSAATTSAQSLVDREVASESTPLSLSALAASESVAAEPPPEATSTSLDLTVSRDAGTSPFVPLPIFPVPPPVLGGGQTGVPREVAHIEPPPSPILPVRVVSPPVLRPLVAPPPLFGVGLGEGELVPEPVAASPAVPAVEQATPPPPPLELDQVRAVLGLDEESTLETVGRVLIALPGLHACLLTVRHECADIGQISSGFDVAGARALAASIAGSVSATSVGPIQHVTVFAGDGCISIFARGSAVLCALHRTRAFLPGVAEKLALVAEALSGA